MTAADCLGTVVKRGLPLVSPKVPIGKKGAVNPPPREPPTPCSLFRPAAGRQKDGTNRKGRRRRSGPFLFVRGFENFGYVAEVVPPSSFFTGMASTASLRRWK